MSTIDIFEDKNSPIEYDLEDGHIIYYPYFFGRQESDNYFQVLKEEIRWTQEFINMFGNKVPLPRETAWYGDSDRPYTYSGITNIPLEWTNVLREVKEKIESISPTTFNSLLLNKYRSGKDKVSWHADDELELDTSCSIGSVSFGVDRPFQLKHKEKPFKEEIILRHGSFLLMNPPTQQYWLHQIPPRKNIQKERINLTFRYINA
jgi:alkylated DNA repair dioxygenase AlkB